LRIRELTTSELTAAEIDEIKALLVAAFAPDVHGGFTEDDWLHSIGGTHFVLQDAADRGEILGHASVVVRDIHIAGRPFRTGYVEAVAIRPGRQHQGLGTLVMAAVNAHVDAGFELGALGTGSQPFYERLGWEIWPGPSMVRAPSGDQPTPNEDGYILVRETPHSPPLRRSDPISCEWRPGDVW
jgi:aminoglycoside 2'-N-acetyltransferase I